MHKVSSPACLICISADARWPREHFQTWEKVLWKQQKFPDNYTDSSFLRSLQVNNMLLDRDYWQLVVAASAITQQISTVAFVVSVSVYLYEVSDCRLVL